MADDINNNEGMGEAGDAGMPDDLKRLLARAEQGEDGDPDAYNPDADDEEEDDDAELEESFGESRSRRLGRRGYQRRPAPDFGVWPRR